MGHSRTIGRAAKMGWKKKRIADLVTDPVARIRIYLQNVSDQRGEISQSCQVERCPNIPRMEAILSEAETHTKRARQGAVAMMPSQYDPI